MFAGKVIVFDLDGAICNVDHRRHWVASKPKNWAAWDAGLPNDTPNEDIIWMLNSFLDSGDIRIILCSGRDSRLREATEAWLAKHHVYYDFLYMRASGDNRKDSIVKVELLHDIQRDWAWPWLWVDDRDQVVKAIREQGVRVLQVAPGDFDVLGKMEVLERPKSKWPYWILYKENQSDEWSHSIDYQHLMLKLDLIRDKIPVVVERQWGQYTGWNGRYVKKQYGLLYKFLKEEDRLLFLISQETGNELH